MDSPAYQLPDGIRGRTVPIRDLDMHILETGDSSSPLLLLLHGFPELSVSWRKVMLPLAALGYRVVAPDQRGYGRTTPRTGYTRPISYEDDLQPFKMINLVTDIVALAYALGYRTVSSVVGHDFGSGVAGYCALIRPDVFKSVVLMSAPFTGPPSLPFDVDNPHSPATEQLTSLAQMVDVALAALQPPRKHYTAYFSGPDANADMVHAPQGLSAFLGAYFHMKSADWPENDPHPLGAPNIANLATMPHYYIMPLEATMADVVQRGAPSKDEAERNSWLPDAELALFTAQFGHTGFQGGLNWYRCMRDAQLSRGLTVFAGKRIEVPAMYLSGKKDWGVYQTPGAAEKMRYDVCAQMEEEDFVLVEGAGHWVQQEQPEQVIAHLARFLNKVKQ
ncbi:Bifunctional epoxide hydrolase 2 [Sparassis crispa]|uniref:Bifunctional epoxide hydrolase 2 n=1 Tax=Sparassis crispa TaxID=139825 RepID=A0A401GNN7_9APHY|nr:Bifunctional epoxide hydrolase 2 [Sparassis crispa]GBE83790.1 Bifunctional epoxide hydrolase 2 [Sparassis crispa]